MSDTVKCVKTGREGKRLTRQPYPNELGRRIFESVSQDGWDLWISHSTMLVNEYRMDVSSKGDTERLLKHCEEFFFGEGGSLPDEYRPPGADDASGSDEK